jgi:hypothetical protein
LLIEIAMPRKSPKQRQRKSKFADGFRISTRPVVRSSRKREHAAAELDDIGVLRAHGAPVLFAVARDPGTIFACWSIDWSAIFKRRMPVDKQVHLRVHRADGSEENSVVVEPMVGHGHVRLSRPSSTYHVEIGYYQPAGFWNSVAASGEVGMPLDKSVETADVDLATIPFHLRFQQLLDLFGAPNSDALAEIISRFQTQALRSNEHHQLESGNRKILRAMGISTRELADARRAFLDQADGEIFRQRAEALLSFFPTSPSRGFGEGDRTPVGS